MRPPFPTLLKSCLAFATGAALLYFALRPAAPYGDGQTGVELVDSLARLVSIFTHRHGSSATDKCAEGASRLRRTAGVAGPHRDDADELTRGRRRDTRAGTFLWDAAPAGFASGMGSAGTLALRPQIALHRPKELHLVLC